MVQWSVTGAILLMTTNWIICDVECHQNGYKIEYKIEYNTVIMYSSLKEKSIACF